MPAVNLHLVQARSGALTGEPSVKVKHRSGAIGDRYLETRGVQGGADLWFGANRTEIAGTRTDEETLAQAVVPSNEAGADQATAGFQHPRGLGERRGRVIEAVQVDASTLDMDTDLRRQADTFKRRAK